MKTFNGKDFLKQKTVRIELSNGNALEVGEIAQETMDRIQTMEEGDSAKGLKEQLGVLCGVEPSTFDGVGLVELRGALDFLFESLFGSK